MTWAAMVERWMRRFVAGEIVFDPLKVEARWVPAADAAPGRFRATLNTSRKDRLAEAA